MVHSGEDRWVVEIRCGQNLVCMDETLKQWIQMTEGYTQCNFWVVLVPMTTSQNSTGILTFELILSPSRPKMFEYLSNHGIMLFFFSLISLK